MGARDAVTRCAVAAPRPQAAAAAEVARGAVPGRAVSAHAGLPVAAYGQWCMDVWLMHGGVGWRCWQAVRSEGLEVLSDARGVGHPAMTAWPVVPGTTDCVL